MYLIFSFFPQAAGVIHSDFEKGFIRAEITHYDDMITQGKIHHECFKFRINDKNIDLNLNKNCIRYICI